MILRDGTTKYIAHYSLHFGLNFCAAGTDPRCLAALCWCFENKACENTAKNTDMRSVVTAKKNGRESLSVYPGPVIHSCGNRYQGRNGETDMLLRRDAETNQHSFSRSVDTHLQAEKLRKTTELPSGEKALETSTWISFGESFY
ncbi:MAG: hypothetical protein P1V13_04580 [Rhizobiaceae bacterium]|nr:hypothetical protein [Rhizobiaceae bacterium]